MWVSRLHLAVQILTRHGPISPMIFHLKFKFNESFVLMLFLATVIKTMADSRLASSQWETSLPLAGHKPRISPKSSPGRLKIVCAKRAPLKLKFLNEWMNEKNILGFKLCAEAENFFQTPWISHSATACPFNKIAERMSSSWFHHCSVF